MALIRLHIRPWAGRARSIGAVIALACAALAGTGAATSTAASYQLPVDTASTPDPGVLLYQGGFYAFSTGGSFGLWESTAPIAGGPWTKVDDSASTGNAVGDVMVHANLPTWIDQSAATWAPDMVQTSTGEFVVYFAAQLAGIPSSNPPGDDAKPAGGARCIGSAESASPRGPFTVDQNPVVCLTGYGAADDMTGDPAGRVLGEGVIDPDPAYVTVGGAQELFLLYKTQAGNGDSTIRMARLAVDDGTSVLGDSHQLLSAIPTGSGGSYVFGDTIEAPTLVQNGSWFVLMVAHGSYGTCGYSTEWFKSQHIWAWTNSGGSTLLDSATTGELCGPGSADISASEVSGQYRLFFAAWVQNGTDGVPASSSSGATREMYADVLTFGSDGYTPGVSPLAPAS
jgi:beta-xylosidase